MCYCLNRRPFFQSSVSFKQTFFDTVSRRPFLMQKCYQMTANLEDYKTYVIIKVERVDHIQFTWLLLSSRNCSLDDDWLECLPWRSHDLE